MTPGDPKPTHTGWFLFCPVYLAFDDDPSEGPVVWARWWPLEPLFVIAGWLQGIAIFLLSMNPDYEPAFMFSRVRKIEQ